MKQSTMTEEPPSASLIDTMNEASRFISQAAGQEVELVALKPATDPLKYRLQLCYANGDVRILKGAYSGQFVRQMAAVLSELSSKLS